MLTVQGLVTHSEEKNLDGVREADVVLLSLATEETAAWLTIWPPLLAKHIAANPQIPFIRVISEGKIAIYLSRCF